MKKLVVNNKEKQQVQDKEVFLYKLYNISPSRPKLTFIQDKVNNLDKYMKYMQSLVTTTLFYPPPYYKSIQPQGEQDEQYQKEIAVKFLKKKHNIDTIRKEFPIEMYIGGPYEPYFIALTLWREIVIGPTKKLVVSYVVGDLILLNQFMRT